MGKIKVCLDAGHYGKYNQSHAVKSYYESDMNWKLHLKLKAELEKYGIEVITTRSSQDVDRGLKERGKASQGCNLFLSIHSNATGSAVDNATDYPLVIVPLDGSGDALGNKLAKCIEDVMGTQQKGRIYERASESGNDWYGVIRGATSVGVPGLILEHSFHTNTKMAKWLLDDGNLDKMAKAEAKVIADYYGLKQGATYEPVDVSDYVELNVNDIVTFTGCVQYNSSDATTGTACEPGQCKITKKYKYGSSKHPYHVVKTGKSGPYGWVDVKDIAETHKKAEPAPQKLYRIRKSWSDASSQKGAYEKYDGAVKCCQDAGAGYHVFDWNGKVVYSYVSTVAVPKEEPVKNDTMVYDLNYPNKVKIVELHKSFDSTELKRDYMKVIKCITASNSNFDIRIAKAFFALAPKYGIDPIMAISQSILETGWFKYQGSAVKAEQHNYCGMGVTSNGEPGNSFRTVEDGVKAQLQHLYAYGCTDILPDGEDTIVDPRFKYVTRGIAPYWQNLAGRWAVPGYDQKTYATPEDAMKAGNTYGQKIIAICEKLKSTSVIDTDIKTDIHVEQEIQIEKKEPQDVAPVIPNESLTPNDNASTNKMNYIFKIIQTLLEAIINIFKKIKG